MSERLAQIIHEALKHRQEGGAKVCVGRGACPTLLDPAAMCKAGTACRPLFSCQYPLAGRPKPCPYARSVMVNT